MESRLIELQTFSHANLPTLDVAVLGALELFERDGIPKLPVLPEGQILIVGSVNAAAAGRIIGQNRNALFADESDYMDVLAKNRAIEVALLISASGGKHAIEIAKHFKRNGVRTILITHNPNALAKEFVAPTDFVVFPKNREPYTYNTSTYLGVILASTQEDSREIRTYIENTITPLVPDNFAKYDAFYITVPSRFRHMVPMLMAKFDELFAPRVSGRVFTVDHAKHATTVVTSPTEFFISFGEDKVLFGPPENQLVVPLSPNASYGFLMAVSYYIIGHIQKQHPPYFKEGVVEYCKRASALFGQEISPIVE
jgi:hypothetical protein